MLAPPWAAHIPKAAGPQGPRGSGQPSWPWPGAGPPRDRPLGAVDSQWEPKASTQGSGFCGVSGASTDLSQGQRRQEGFLEGDVEEGLYPKMHWGN